MLRIYNSHFTESCLWKFESEAFKKICNSWNVNLKVILDLPYGTHNYIVEQVSGGNNAKKMIWCRYIKFVDSLIKNKRSSIVSLFKTIQNDVRSVTGSNLRKIMLDSSKLVIPGVTKKIALYDFNVYDTPEGEEWRVPLLFSLLEMREERWTVQFDEELDDMLPNDAIKTMIERVCVE